MHTAYAKQHIPTRRHKNHEALLHRQICRYLRNEFPDLIFRSDGGGLPLSGNQAALFKSIQSSSGFPDLTIYHPSRGYMALMIELKREGTTIYLKTGKRKGEIVQNEHIRAQASILKRLNDLGYCARFGVGYDKTIELIQWYMQMPVNTELF